MPESICPVPGVWAAVRSSPAMTSWRSFRARQHRRKSRFEVTLALARRHGARTAEDDDEWRKTADKVRLLGAVWIAYGVGGVSAGVLTMRVGFRAIALPLATLILAILLDWRLAHEGAEGAGGRDE